MPPPRQAGSGTVPSSCDERLLVGIRLVDVLRRLRLHILISRPRTLRQRWPWRYPERDVIKLRFFHNRMLMATGFHECAYCCFDEMSSPYQSASEFATTDNLIGQTQIVNKREIVNKRTSGPDNAVRKEKYGIRVTILAGGACDSYRRG